MIRTKITKNLQSIFYTTCLTSCFWANPSLDKLDYSGTVSWFKYKYREKKVFSLSGHFLESNEKWCSVWIGLRPVEGLWALLGLQQWRRRIPKTSANEKKRKLGQKSESTVKLTAHLPVIVQTLELDPEKFQSRLQVPPVFVESLLFRLQTRLFLVPIAHQLGKPNQNQGNQVPATCTIRNW